MSTEELWKKYKKTKDIELKKKLIEEYIPLVKIVAGRLYNYYGSKIEYDDLLGFGVLGLIDSIDRFDINKNVKFSTYAQIRIRGTVIDNIRKLDWIPRSLRKKAKELQNSISILENKNGQTPTNKELAEHLNISVEDVENTLSDIATFNMVSLEEFISDKGEYKINTSSEYITPEEAYENIEMKEILIESISSLTKQEQLVISLYYYDELTYKEIGSVLNLSESRISQIHSKSILKMKRFLEKKGFNI